jgi:hypothetical protein
LTAEAGPPIAERPAVVRWVIAAIIALPAAIAVLMLSGGDVLVAYGKAPQAARLPRNNVLPAEAMLAGLDSGESTRQAQAGAREALRSSPLSGGALAYLATQEAPQGGADHRIRLRAIAGKVGWHGEWSQRRLYNAALAAGDAGAALRHAEALLRQQYARDELFAQFVRGMDVPGFRSELIKAVARSPHWPRQFLVQRGAELDDAALLELASARAESQGGLDRQLAAPLLTRLVSLGRLEAAATISRLIPGDPRPGVLAWPDELAMNAPTPFDWNLPPSYAVDRSEGARLVADKVLPGEFARRLIVLPPGEYRLLAPASEGWLWGTGCAGGTVVPNRPLSANASFTAPPDCPLIALVLAPANTGTTEQLGEVSLKRLPSGPGEQAR